MMRFVAATVLVIVMCATSVAAGDATRLKTENGKLIVAQSYCGICFDNATACRLACNGSGTCIQACDDRLQDCRELNCGVRRR
jgi:hypothetical protein